LDRQAAAPQRKEIAKYNVDNYYVPMYLLLTELVTNFLVC